MPYLTGSVNSYSELITVIHSHCVANGWALSNGVLSKGKAFVKLALHAGADGTGVTAQGGSGRSAGTLVNPSASMARLGTPRTGTVDKWATENWPAVYHLHLHTDPDEVFVILNFNITSYYWLAFGMSAALGLSGTGLWLAGTCGSGSYGTSGLSISPTSGGANSIPCAAPFWETYSSYGVSGSSSFIHADEGPTGWSKPGGGSEGNLIGITYAAPLIASLPSVWNAETILLPIKAYQLTAASKVRLVLDMRHARHLRIDNLVPGQVLTFGHERWKVYPYFKKNATDRDGGGSIGHTGTFGWCIRYDGD